MTVYAGYSLATVAELTAIASTERTDLFLLYVGEKNRWYRYDPSATGTPDNDNTINPDDSEGRWLAVGAASAGGGDGGDGGGESYVGVQNGRPTETPTATGIIIADSRSDRGVLWISVGTNSADDWKAFGYRPVIAVNFADPRGNVTPDFVGQQFIYTQGGPNGSTDLYVATGTNASDWRRYYNFSNS